MYSLCHGRGAQFARQSVILCCAILLIKNATVLFTLSGQTQQLRQQQSENTGSEFTRHEHDNTTVAQLVWPFHVRNRVASIPTRHQRIAGKRQPRPKPPTHYCPAHLRCGGARRRGRWRNGINHPKRCWMQLLVRHRLDGDGNTADDGTFPCASVGSRCVRCLRVGPRSVHSQSPLTHGLHFAVYHVHLFSPSQSQHTSDIRRRHHWRIAFIGTHALWRMFACTSQLAGATISINGTTTADACGPSLGPDFRGIHTFVIPGNARHGSRELRYYGHAKSERQEIELIHTLFQWRPHAMLIDRWRSFPDLPQSPGGFPTIVELDVESERFMGLVRLAAYFGTNASLVWVLATPGPGNAVSRHQWDAEPWSKRQSQQDATHQHTNRSVMLTNGRVKAGSVSQLPYFSQIYFITLNHG